ncbi:MAG: GPR1/FUN34/YaaH family transporter [Sporichthyaceae bacterium]
MTTPSIARAGTDRIPSPRHSIDATAVPVEAPTPAAAPAADPMALGLPVFIVGALALGLSFTTFLPATAASGILPIVMAASGLGLVLATMWAIDLGQSVVAGVLGTFAGFWLSYAVLVLGLTHGWFAIAATDVKETVGTFQLCWAVVAGLLTLATLRLPLAYSLLIALVTLALSLATAATYNASTSLSKAAGYVVLAFALNGVYLFLHSTSVALGGPAYPLGRAIVR